VSAFSSEGFLPPTIIQRITDARVDRPDVIREAARKRRRRETLTEDGRLNILAADHPARRVTQVGDDPLAMANRHDFLARVVRVVSGDGVDGVMATMDVLEDLLILDWLIREEGHDSFLDGKLLIPSLNRGGLSGAVWELDDPMTGPSPEACVALCMDGGKILLRVSVHDGDSLKTIVATADILRRMSAVNLPVFLEPLPVVKGKTGFQVIKEADALAQLVGVATALGDTTSGMWLKLPYCENFDAVARSTTLPILLLGGQAVGDATPLLRQVVAGLNAGANVRGTMVGRNVLYPGDADPLAVAGAIHDLVHQNGGIDDALNTIRARQGENMDRITACFAGKLG
jgi:DhnA family fructose-bisphosphate aldolase class Ia